MINSLCLLAIEPSSWGRFGVEARNGDVYHELYYSKAASNVAIFSQILAVLLEQLARPIFLVVAVLHRQTDTESIRHLGIIILAIGSCPETCQNGNSRSSNWWTNRPFVFGTTATSKQPSAQIIY